MAKNSKTNFKTLKNEELSKRLHELEEHIRSLRFKSQGSRSKNVKEFGALKREVARVLTEISTRSKAKNK